MLLPRPFRFPAAVLLAVCVAVTAVLGIVFAGHRQASRLDAVVDPALKASVGHVTVLCNVSDAAGTLIPVSLMTLALTLACLVTRRWSGAVLAVVATPAASALTEFVLKPLVHRTLLGALTYPSGHATSMFALAVSCGVLLLDPPGHRVPAAVRLLLACLALLVATTVSVGMVARGAHYFTDVVAGAALGTGVVLACALTLDRRARSRPGRAVHAGSSTAAGQPSGQAPPLNR